MSQLPSPSHNAPGAPVLPLWSKLLGAGLVLALLVTVTVLTVNVWLAARLSENLRRGSREHAFWVLCQPGHSAAARGSAFLQLAATGNQEWRSADLGDLTLPGLKLPGAELSGAFFKNANLAGANLVAVKAVKASFANADLSGADLAEAELSESHFYRTRLGQANLRRAKLRAAYLQEAQAEKADLMMADLSDADCLMANLTGAKLNCATLSGVNLEAAVLRGANLSLARLEGTKLKEADFTNANWWRARGLSPEQISLLKTKFAPGTNAEPALKADYEKWLNSSPR